ncbi:DUF4287 domain-containing protein [Brevundimonas sp. 2R-24]|uniref:DUF4287 domain-containing protein n=1 Tax=Peiella sedimenti TaxID=3061083 RepID=A0ABT8SHN6_9CAUL|nr:DUF4287 domain-containing protein [Caulobacteraceae bacterium XZ-24]
MADPNAELATMIANLEAKTGLTLDGWTALVRTRGPEKHGQIVAWLKSEHGLGHGYANLVAHKALGSDAGSQGEDDLLAAMFAGPKAAMRPVYDRVLAVLDGLEGVELAPKKGYVSFRRSKQFGLGQPSTKDRFDLGLNLKGVEPEGRLEAAGSWNAMVTHRVRLGSAEEVDAQVAGWLTQAWERA